MDQVFCIFVGASDSCHESDYNEPGFRDGTRVFELVYFDLVHVADCVVGRRPQSHTLPDNLLCGAVFEAVNWLAEQAISGTSYMALLHCEVLQNSGHWKAWVTLGEGLFFDACLPVHVGWPRLLPVSDTSYYDGPLPSSCPSRSEHTLTHGVNTSSPSLGVGFWKLCASDGVSPLG